MIKEMVTEEFLAELSSKKPTPGGGGAAALGGAAGVSLGQMVINLTLGKKKYADVEEEMKELLEQLETLKAEFLHLADEDARVFAPLAAAYGLPSPDGKSRSAPRDGRCAEGSGYHGHSGGKGEPDGGQRRGRGRTVYPNGLNRRGHERMDQYEIHERQGEGRGTEPACRRDDALRDSSGGCGLSEGGKRAALRRAVRRGRYRLTEREMRG